MNRGGPRIIAVTRASDPVPMESDESGAGSAFSDVATTGIEAVAMETLDHAGGFDEVHVDARVAHTEDLDGLRTALERVGSSARVRVAEMMPRPHGAGAGPSVDEVLERVLRGQPVLDVALAAVGERVGGSVRVEPGEEPPDAEHHDAVPLVRREHVVAWVVGPAGSGDELEAHRELLALCWAVDVQQSVLAEHAFSDPFTGLRTRAYLSRHLRREVVATQAAGQAVAVAVVSCSGGGSGALWCASVLREAASEAGVTSCEVGRLEESTVGCVVCGPPERVAHLRSLVEASGSSPACAAERRAGSVVVGQSAWPEDGSSGEGLIEVALERLGAALSRS